jgi:hypothetical protein
MMYVEASLRHPLVDASSDIAKAQAGVDAVNHRCVLHQLLWAGFAGLCLV